MKTANHICTQRSVGLIGLFHFLRLYTGYTVVCPDPPEWNPEVPVIRHYSTLGPLSASARLCCLIPTHDEAIKGIT